MAEGRRVAGLIRWSPGVTLAVAVLAVAGLVAGALVADLPDLHVYRYGGQAVLEQLSPYAARDPVTGYPFTYPPFAAVAFVPLAVVPSTLAAALWTATSAACLAVTVVVVRRSLGRSTPGWLLLVLVVGSLALEPVWQNFAFGQINAVLMVMAVADLLRPDRRGSGLLVGLAAGLKLTPLVFVVLLVLIGRRAAAARSLLAFAGTVAVGFVAMPGASASYWAGRLLDPGRVGPPQLAHNQSVSGALARVLDGTSTPLWLAVAVPLLLVVLLVAAAAWRRGQPALATCLAALGMLLASPVSWSHHWVWAVPVALVVWQWHRLAAGLWVAVFVARPVLWPPWGEEREFDWRWFEHVLGNAYLLAALVVVLGAAVALRRAAPRARAQGP